MKSSVYISSEKIEVIGYSKSGRRVSVKDYKAAPLPEGTMINGKIIDPAALTECLSGMRRNNPALFSAPALIVDGSTILSKSIAAPKLNAMQYDQLIMDEFSDSYDNPEELVCGYYPLGRKEDASAMILACAADKPQIDSYISAFKNAGINLKSIRIGVQAILNYVRAKPQLQKTTFVINVIDGFTMLSMIFENNINVFTSRTRLYDEDGEGLVRNLLDSLSGLIQFNKSQKFSDITCSYYLGLSNANLDILKQINPYSESDGSQPVLSIDALDIFSGSGNSLNLPADAHFVYLNTMLGKNSIDLIRGYKNMEKRKRLKLPKKRWIPVFAAIILVLLIPAALLFKQIRDLDRDIGETVAYNTSESTVARLNEIDGIKSETDRLSNIIGEAELKMDEEKNRVPISNQILDLITRTSGDTVEITQLDFNEISGTVRVDGGSAAETDSAKYVEAIKKSPLVKDVEYKGYSYGSKGEYSFSIVVILDAGDDAL